jgi:minor extracellular serine protease Vpr
MGSVNSKSAFPKSMLTSQWFSRNRLSSLPRIVTAGVLVLAAAAMCSVALRGGTSGGGSTGPNASADNFDNGPTVDTSSAIVQLKGDPLSTYSVTKPAHGKKIDFNSSTVKSYRAQLSAERNNFKNWLHTYAPKAKITSQYDISLNAVAVQLNGTSLDTLAGAPMVQQVQYNGLYHPDLSQSYKVINASGAWASAGGRSNAGAGIKIGDIDTGIDQNHPFFDATGFSYPAGFPKCDAADSTTHTADHNCEYVSPKVIVAKVFDNKANVQGLDAQAVQDHGSHTAGIAAGVTGKTATVSGVSISDLSGVAPGAWLGNYNVFPGNVANARSEDILNAVDAAIADGMDVLNLSLGGSPGKSGPGTASGTDVLSIGLDNAVDAGVVVAVAAGNSGPGAQTVESPGRAPKVITAGASTNQHFIGEPFTYPSSGGTTVGAAVGDFAALPTGSDNLFDTASDGCASVSSGASGKLAIIDRGTCTFSQKVANAKAAGAVGVLIINNVAGDPSAMARTSGFDDNIPAVMIGLNEGAALRTSGATTAQATDALQDFITTNADILAGFSSQGPTSVDLAIKPDATSVGVNVLSSITCVGKAITCGGEGSWAFFSGTSMATPHLAGSSAVLLQLHPGWTPDQVKSALANTADLVIKDAKTGTMDVGPTAQGAGRENLTNAAGATILFQPDSASFGKVSGSKNNSAPFTFILSNTSSTAQAFSVAALKFTPSTSASLVPFDAGTTTSGDSRISFPGSVTVPANGATSLTVSVNGGLAPGTVVQGWITLTGPSGPYHFAYYAVVGP